MASFLADSVKITSRSSDGTVTISFSTGEYQREAATQMFLEAQTMIDNHIPIQVSIQEGDGNS